jgi:hypothetical protein
MKRPSQHVFGAVKALSTFGLSSFLAALCAGCDGCQSEKPYTPFGPASSWEDEASAPVDAGERAGDASADAGPAFTPKRAIVAPKNARKWTLEGQEIVAPEGRHFELGLASDFDHDGKLEAVAWHASDESSSEKTPGALWLYPSAGEPRELTKVPGFVPSSPDCSSRVSLDQTGPHTLALAVRADCKSAVVARSPIAALVVLAPAETRPPLLTLRVSAPAQGERLDLEVVSADRDGDDRDDILLTVRGGRADARNAAAELIWFDRPQGLSREPSEPKGAFSRLAKRAKGRLARGQKSNDVSTEDVYRLYASLCEEAGTPRVFDADGSAFRCGPLETARLRKSDVTAAIAEKDLLEAVRVLLMGDWFEPKMLDTERTELAKKIETAFPPRQLGAPTVVSVVPRTSPVPVRYAPLSFDAANELWVETADGTLEHIGPDGSPLPSEEGVRPLAWPLDVQNERGERITSVVPACDRSEVLLMRTSSAGTILEPIPTDVLAPRPGACRGARGPEFAVSVLDYREDQLNLVIAGSRTVRSKDATGEFPRGSARSQNGRWLVVPTPLGLALLGDRSELWQHAETRTSSLDCVPSNDGTRVACASGRRALLFKRE